MERYKVIHAARVARAIVAAGAAALIVAACGSSAGSPSGSGSTAAAGESSSANEPSSASESTATLNLSMPGPITGVDPANTILQQNVWLTHLLSGTLFVGVPGSETGQVEPGLARSGALAPNKLSAVVTLKPNLKFANGAPLTVKDVVATYTRDLTGKNIGGLFFQGITKVAAAGANKIKFTFGAPNPNYKQQLAEFAFGILPANSWKAKHFATAPVSSGMYTESGSLTGNTVTLTANPNYAGPKPAVKKLIFHVVPNPATAANELQAGQLDFASQILNSSAKQLSSSFTVRSVESWGIDVVTPNPTNHILANPSVRKAIALGVNRAALAEIATSGTGAGAPSPLSPNYPTADSARNTIYPETGNVAGAKALLKRTACANGCTLQLLVDSADPTQPLVATALQQQLKAIGITVQLVSLDQTTYNDRAYAGNFQLLMTGGGGFGYDPTLALNFDPKGPTGALFSKWSNPKVPVAIAAARAASAAQRPAALHRLVELFDQDTPWVPLVSRPQVSAATHAAGKLVFFSPTGLLDVAWLK